MFVGQSGEQPIVPIPAAEAGGADDLLGAVQLRGDVEAAPARRLLDRLVPRASRGKRRRRKAPELLHPVPRRSRMKAGETALAEHRARQVERTAKRLAAADGNDARPGGEGVEPFGGGGHAGADHGHPVGVLVRLVRVDGAWVALELGG